MSAHGVSNDQTMSNISLHPEILEFMKVYFTEFYLYSHDGSLTSLFSDLAFDSKYSTRNIPRIR